MAELVFLRRGEEVMRYQLDGMITTIGRGGRNDIAFPEHEPYISREHASVEKRGGGFWLRDLSHDGILLDGLSVKEGLLRDGALFSLGKWQVRFQAKSAGMELGTLTRGGGTLPVFDRDQHSEAGKAFLCFDLDGERIERPFTSSALTIGSSPNNDLRLSMPYISSFHCRIYQRDGRYFLRDLESKNGSWINGLRTIEGEIPEGAELYLGKFPMRFVIRKESQNAEYPGFAGIISRDPVMEPIFELIRRVASHEATVLILGESGSGKELVARAIHDVSNRQRESFRALNCGVISKELIGSELFGHERGAFTGAVQSHQGAFEEAGAGTLFLDEIGDLPLEQQVAFLRVLEVGSYRRLGGSKDLTNQARIVTATHRDLWQLIRAGTFREDLYHRISVLPIALPPLRARVQDIALLAQFFIQRFAQHRDLRLSDEALLALQTYSWPGNVRELRNVIQRAIVMVNGREISAADLHIRPEYTDNAHHFAASGYPSGSAPYHAAGSGGHTYYPNQPPAPVHPYASAQPHPATSAMLPNGATAHPSAHYGDISTHSPSGGVALQDHAANSATSLDETERQAIVQALEGCRGNVTEAARRLGIGRSSLYSKMNRHGIVSVHYKSR